MASIVSWVLQVSIREGHFEDFRKLMHEMVESTRAEPGTLIYEWFISEDQKSCHIYERYADSAATMAHVGNFGSMFATRFVEFVEPTSMHVYGDPASDVRAALDGLGAEYLSPFGGFGR